MLLLLAMQIIQMAEWPGYLVSNTGHVYTELRRGRGSSKPRRQVTPVENKDGYLCVRLTRDGHRHKRPIHRLVLEAFVGSRPEGHVARHLNGKKQDNRLKNLKWGTVKENGEDAVRLGEQPRGETHGMAKLTEADVLDIRGAYAEGGWTQQALADEYGVSQKMISNVVNLKFWKHV